MIAKQEYSWILLISAIAAYVIAKDFLKSRE